MENDDTTTPVIQRDQAAGQAAGEFAGRSGSILQTPDIPSAYEQDSPYNPGPRPAYVNGVYNPSYSGPGVVDRNGQLVIGPGNQPYYYNLNNDPTKTFFGMSEQQRATNQDRMEARGISVNTPSQYINALGFLMELGNNIGRDWETALTKLESMTPLQEEKVYAPRYRVTSPDDIRAVADESARRVLGRKFSADELNQFVQSYQQQEISYQQAMSGSGVVTAAPSVAAAAESFASRVDPSQANAYKFLGFFDKLASSLRSRI